MKTHFKLGTEHFKSQDSPCKSREEGRGGGEGENRKERYLINIRAKSG